MEERKNRYLVEMLRCLLLDSNLSEGYWAEPWNTTVYLQNILPTKPVNSLPYALWHGTKPDVENLKVFGCSAWVHIPKEKQKMLTPTAKELVFVDLSLEYKAYRFPDRYTKSDRDVRFIESAPDVRTEVGHQKKKPIVRPVIFFKTSGRCLSLARRQ